MEFSKLLLSELPFSEATSRQLGELLPCSGFEDYKPEAHEDLALLRLGIWHQAMNHSIDYDVAEDAYNKPPRWWFGRIEC